MSDEIKCNRKARNSSCLIQSVERSNKSFRQPSAIIKSYLTSNFYPRREIKILSSNNLDIIKRCMINTNRRLKPLFLVKLGCFQKFIQIIDLFSQRKIVSVVIIILKSNFIFLKVCFYNKIFIFSDTKQSSSKVLQ